MDRRNYFTRMIEEEGYIYIFFNLFVSVVAKRFALQKEKAVGGGGKWLLLRFSPFGGLKKDRFGNGLVKMGYFLLVQPFGRRILAAWVEG